ncbi:MAG: penicillin-binding protein 1C [Deltaproteobacteria bacterium HGW-Deltaproteobacteria-14]|nr:MAG: penicillin-binding protein 1C [Deltaproteobacteria bacterium HGW-Deltaproteobacteria-14]
MRRLLRRAYRVAARVAVALSAVVIGLASWIAAVPFPEDALAPTAVTSTAIVDRDGGLLREVLSDREGRGRWVALADISPHLALATVHAEDKRFRDHHGIDGIAIVRSLVTNLRAGDTVTGASTLTQQVVKMTLHAGEARTLGTKLMEAVWALRLEGAHTKDEILEQYLNRAPYGNQLYGVEAAAWMYFGKPASRLSLAESALLAGIPQSPSRQNPYRDLGRALSRQRSILAAMRERGVISQDDLRIAEAEEIRVLPRRNKIVAPHLTDRVAAALTTAEGPRPGVVATTLDSPLQRRVEAVLARQQADRITHGAFQAAAVVLDTRTSEVLAWVGSRDYFDAAALGANDGVTALRQPGSALKPLVYGAWLDHGGSAATLLADLPTEFPTDDGVYRPQNYDRRFHGPVTVREALASSLNIPAVLVAEQVGVDRLLETLHAAGLDTLTLPAEHYGLGLALGNGEVRLIDLAGAYAALGRLGSWRPVRWLADAPAGETRQVLTPATAFTLLEMLTDDHARGIGFGEGGALALPYRVAAKTGTSSDFRDNWAVGVTPDYTVAAWVGNFDGRPMNRVSGSVGAAPTVRQILQFLYPRAAGRGDVAWYTPPAGVVSARLCRVNGRLASARCERTFDEWLGVEAFARAGDGDDGYVALRVDRQSGLRAGPGCGDDEVDVRAFAALPAAWRSWALDNRIRIAPEAWSPRCPGAGPAAPPLVPELISPLAGDRFFIDRGQAREVQLVRLRATGDGGGPLTFFVDGAPVATVGSPFATSWALAVGEHDIAVGRGRPEDGVRITVR